MSPAYEPKGRGLKKRRAKARRFFNEIKPCGICEIRFAREMWLAPCEMPAGVVGFISFHVRRQPDISRLPTGIHFTSHAARYFTEPSPVFFMPSSWIPPDYTRFSSNRSTRKATDSCAFMTVCDRNCLKCQSGTDIWGCAKGALPCQMRTGQRHGLFCHGNGEGQRP